MSKYPLTAADKKKMADNFLSSCEVIAIVSMIGVENLPPELVQKLFSTVITTLLTGKVLVMHYTEADAEREELVQKMTQDT